MFKKLTKIIIITYFLWGHVNAMCDFPHNPAVYCLEYTISDSKKIKGSEPFNCKNQLKSYRFFRPPNTYNFDEKLEKKVQKSFKEIKFKSSKRIKNPEVLYSNDCKIKSSGKIVVYLSCYDRWEHIPDFLFLTDALDTQEIVDPWTQKKVRIDCTKLSSKKKDL